MEYTNMKSYDDEIKVLDIKHKEKVDNMHKVIEELTEKYIKERQALVEKKVRKELQCDTIDYLEEFIEIDEAKKYIKKSAGYIYQHLYDKDTQEPSNGRFVPAHKRGTRYFFIRKELQDWMMQKDKELRNNEVEKRANEYLASH